MPAILLGTAAYKRLDMTPSLLLNMIVEETAANLEDQIVLLARPGLTALHLVEGDVFLRGMFREEGSLSGVLVFVCGETAFSYNLANATLTTLGTVPGAERVSIAGSTAYVLIANGTGLYSTNGGSGSIATVTVPDGAGVTSVIYINGYFVISRAGSQRFYWSAVGGITFAALDFLSAENWPDQLVCIVKVGDELWMLGQTSTELWTPTGDPDAAFLRINGRLFGVGCVNRATVTKCRDAAFWIGDDRMVYRSGDGPTRISNHHIEERLRLASAADLTAWSYVADGHPMVVFNTGAETLAYDISTDTWTRFSSYGQATFKPAVSAPGLNGSWVCGDGGSGQLWTLDLGRSNDAGAPLVREFSGVLDVSAPSPCPNVILDCSVGTAAAPTDDPMIAMRTSDDEGRNFKDWRVKPLGRQGDTRRRVSWRKNGRLSRPGRLFHWRVTDDVAFDVRRAKVAEDIR